MTSKGRSNIKLTQAVVTNPQVQKMSLIQSHTFSETSTRRSHQILNYADGTKKHKSPVIATEESDLAQN